MKKLLITISLTILTGLAVAGHAEAHNATASGTCNGGVTWAISNYEKTQVNSITVTIDGTVRHQDLDFKSSNEGTIATDKTVGHTWSVVVNAPGTQFDRNLSGSYPACVTAPTTTVPSSTTVVVAPTSPETTAPVATTVVTDPTTTVVAVDIPPVPTTVAPTSTVVLTDISTVEPVLPATGLDGGIVGLAVLLVVVGTVLVVRGQRVS